MADARSFFEHSIPTPSGGGAIAPPDVVEPFTEGTLVRVPPPTVAQGATLTSTEATDSGASQIEQEVRERGWDVVAFYAPYHRHGHDFGIYFCFEPFASLVHLMSSRTAVSENFAATWDILHDAVLTHERFHFAVELAATHAEVTTGAPTLYDARLRRYRSTSGLRRAGQVEEAIATADEVIAARRRSPGLAGELELLSIDVAGYGDFGSYISRKLRAGGQQQIVEDLLGAATSGELLARHIARPYFESVPEHWLIPRSLSVELRDLLPRTFPLPISKVLAHARRHGADVQQRTKHQAIVVPGKPRPVTISKNWGKEIPRDFIRSLADLFDLSPGDYCHQVLTEK
ncbi:MAG: hypothetical protein ACSLFD_04820 [Solirubrobacterales bacterium]